MLRFLLFWIFWWSELHEALKGRPVSHSSSNQDSNLGTFKGQISEFGPFLAQLNLVGLNFLPKTKTFRKEIAFPILSRDLNFKKKFFSRNFCDKTAKIIFLKFNSEFQMIIKLNF